MPRIERLTLGCTNPSSQQQFYCELLGMTLFSNGSVGYGGEQASIEFIQAEGRYSPLPSDTYWKIALSVRHIDLACRQLMELGIQVTEPRQFQDVGFLAHFTDPEGFTIELIEQWFEGNRPDSSMDSTVLGGGVCFNLLTLRTAEIEEVESTCLHYGMAPLSVQPVKDFGFTLYFYAFTDDVPPSPELSAVANREWLYQRPYTVLEIQHVHEAQHILAPPCGSAGYVGTEFSGCAVEFDIPSLKISGRAGNLE